jgi:uncharacterized protein (TIGR02001 family)
VLLLLCRFLTKLTKRGQQKFLPFLRIKTHLNTRGKIMKFTAKLWKQTSLATLIILTGTSTMAFGAGKSSGAISGNITATSTYVWRGLAVADAALQGGLDYSTAEGLHAGVWTSNVYFGSELDVTVGFAGSAKGFGYDVGLIVYTYPQYEAGLVGDYDFNELYASISKDMLNARFSTSSEAGSYIEVNANFEKIAAGLDLGLHFGSYDVDTDFAGLPGEDYNDYNVSLGTSVGGFGVSFTLSDTNITDDSYRTFITVSKNFTP